MHQALTSFEDRTWASHFHLGASSRNAAVCGTRRLTMVLMRCTWAGSRSSAFCFLASASTSAYAFSALALIGSEETSMCWRRSTPTAVDLVVSTVWQPERTTAETAAARMIARINVLNVVTAVCADSAM